MAFTDGHTGMSEAVCLCASYLMQVNSERDAFSTRS